MAISLVWWPLYMHIAKSLTMRSRFRQVPLQTHTHTQDPSISWALTLFSYTCIYIYIFNRLPNRATVSTSTWRLTQKVHVIIQLNYLIITVSPECCCQELCRCGVVCGCVRWCGTSCIESSVQWMPSRGVDIQPSGARKPSTLCSMLAAKDV